jgi:hypothetical protein
MFRVPSRIALWLVCLASLARGAEEHERAPRKHRDGPLTAADFQARPDPGSAFTALSDASLDYAYQFRSEARNGQRVARLTSIDVWASFARDKSWNRRPGDPLLLDHEQGHFDLTEIHARAARNHVQALLARRDPSLAARGASDADAQAKLEQALRAILDRFVADAKEANIAYDKATENGRNAAAQAEERRRHKARLEEQAEEWERLYR